MVNRERRRDARFPLSRPIKLHCPQTGKYYFGQSQNISASGAALEIDHPSIMVPGLKVRLGIGWSRQNALLRADEMMEGTVVRSFGLGGTQTVGLQFDKRHEQLAESA